MAIVDIDIIAAYRWTSGSRQLVWSNGWWPPGIVLHSNEQGELLQWLCHDNSTINSHTYSYYYPSGCWSTAPHAFVLTLMRENYHCVYLYYAVLVDVLMQAVDLHKIASC